MCGIAGIVRWQGAPVRVDDVARMCDAIRRRGPDDQGLAADAQAAIGMRRLSIIDVETGQQPVHNEDRSIWAVFNGEIYNFAELRHTLQRRGHRFHTAGDTETIVHLYEDLGPDFVHELRGMFAIAVWDRRHRSLLLARDRLGIKPLFYAHIRGGIAFASELKALLQLPEIDRTLSWPAVQHLLAFSSSPADQSIVEQVRKLEPGHRATISEPDRLCTHRYWDVTFAPNRTATEAELVEELRANVDDAVKSHLVSDVPVGAFLSGGVDSSAVVASMRRAGAANIKTFSVGFNEASHNEATHARVVADAFGTEHHELILESRDASMLEDLFWCLDEPFGDSSALPTYAVSKLAAGHVKVVLTGDGGDEVFGGYDKYVVEAHERRRDAWPRSMRHAMGMIGRAMPYGMRGRRFLQHVALSGGPRYLDASRLFAVDDQTSLFSADVRRQLTTSPDASALRRLSTVRGSWLSALQYADLHGYLPLDILTKVDRMTMAHSLEARPPLLDHRLVEFAATIPPEFVIRGGDTKYLFKKALRGQLPDAIINRRKQGFAVPLSSWFRGDWLTFVEDALRSPTARARGIFNAKAVDQLLRLHAGGRNLDLQLWTLLSFEMWSRLYVDRPAGSAAPEHDRYLPMSASA
jgi:asparagine synthase (glutamine-hydrolysing)